MSDYKVTGGYANVGSEPLPTAKCALCGEPMPEGEEMFKYHGYSGDCPKPPLPQTSNTPITDRETYTVKECDIGFKVTPVSCAKRLELASLAAQAELSTANAKAEALRLEGMVMVQREHLQAALNYIKHCGANKVMRGQPHPQQIIVDWLDAAIARRRESPTEQEQPFDVVAAEIESNHLAAIAAESPTEQLVTERVGLRGPHVG